jgi:membrane-bound metal-dependent hydrolase YbcI (DUF457 family)
MPSPIGHALGGIAAAWPFVPADRRARRAVASALIVSAVAAAPDLDLLVNDHRGPAHSIGAALVAGAAAWLWTRRPRWGVAVALAWASHVLLDWLGTDTRPPIGIMALWPFSTGFYESRFHVFPAISRRYWLAEFWTYNVKALGLELLVLVPVAVVVVWAMRATPPYDGA